MISDLAPQLTALGGNWWDQFDNDRVVYTSGGTQYRSVDMAVVLHAGPDKAATGQPGQIQSTSCVMQATLLPWMQKRRSRAFLAQSV